MNNFSVSLDCINRINDILCGHVLQINILPLITSHPTVTFSPLTTCGTMRAVPRCVRLSCKLVSA
jgi:hypothetical protein